MSKYKVIMVLCSLVMVFIIPTTSTAGYLYHAAPKAVTRRIITKGINPSKFNRNARYWKNMYGSKRASTALAEKGSRNSLIRMKTSKHLEKNFWDLRNPKPSKLRQYVGNMDLRGKVKNRVIGPKLGQKIGKLANHQGKAIKYRSVKTGGTNVAVSKSMIEKHPRALYQKTYYPMH